MMRNLLSKRISNLLMFSLLFSGATMNATNDQGNPLNETPCDDKIIVECDTV